MKQQPDSEALLHFSTLVSDRLGLAFDQDQNSLLREVLQRRAAVQRRTPESYVQELETRTASAEWTALTEQLTVGETYFFRHGEQMQAFLERALPEANARRGDRPLKILCAGCSSGEEPYSLVMLGREAGLTIHQISVLALDINPASLKKARAARYSRWSLRETSEAQRSRWFTARGADYDLDASIASAVEFRQANLLHVAKELAASQPYDIVFCRNVLMYFLPEQARTVVGSLEKALAPGGFLFLGHAETLRGLSEGFELCNTHGCFYYQRQRATASPHPHRAPVDDGWRDTIASASERIRQLGLKPVQVPPLAACQTSVLSEVRDLQESERYGEALALLNGLPDDSLEQPEARLLHAVLLLHSGDVPATEQLCRQLSQHHAYAAGAHYLLALCSENKGDLDLAVAEHRTATRMDPAFAMPHLRLGQLARRAKDVTTARRELEKALVLLQTEDPGRLRLYGGGFGREALLHLCRGELDACRVRR